MPINQVSPIPEITAPAPVGRENARAAKDERTPVKTAERPEKPAENLEKLRTALGEHNISLKYRRDTQTDALVVEMVDEKTGEAVRQIPSEVSLKLAAEFIKLQGQFVDRQVSE
jgi:flagellar protein FlaG